MYNCLSFDELLQQESVSVSFIPMASTNKFIYVKQNFPYSGEPQTTKVLVNPNFNKKVFVNPNFNCNRNIVPPTQFPKIHVNPNAHNIKLETDNCRNVNKILINPNVLRNIPVSTSDAVTDANPRKTEMVYGQNVEVNHTIISTRTKLVRSKARNISDNKIKKRRSSIKSQFKIIKSSLLGKPISNENMELKFNSIKPNSKYVHYSKNSKLVMNKFKLDNRSKKVEVSPRNKKHVYANRFLNISDIARNSLLKQNKKSTVSGHHIKKISNPYRKSNNINIKKIHGNLICKSKYKFIRKLSNTSITNNQTSKQSKSPTLKQKKVGKNTSKLRICNIPCPYYRKFGRCKGKENGKCCRKHDPDQIALCTKFLQGACIDEKCLLSHNVSPEKMPTCKFYLEGSCSRDNCPYLHVRISPKADVCKDFLEGFCKKAAECNKRHQFLCPDYEKTGNCLKQRCPYPHGKMVRKYSVFNKNKFAKKSSNNCVTSVKIDTVVAVTPKSKNKSAIENCTGSIKPRYYIGQNNLDNDGCNHDSNTNQNKNDQCEKSRPKLGKLPSFIAFENI